MLKCFDQHILLMPFSQVAYGALENNIGFLEVGLNDNLAPFGIKGPLLKYLGCQFLLIPFSHKAPTWVAC